MRPIGICQRRVETPRKEIAMRMLITATMSVDKFNAAVRDGTASEKISHILELTKPEAVYFTETNGRRTALIIADVAEPASVPALSEPWFLNFDAQVEFRIAMTSADLRQAGLEKLGKKWA